MTNKYQTIINNLKNWGEKSEKLYGAVIIGSQSRIDNMADEYSDIDIIMFVDDSDYFINSDQWLENVGKYYISFIEHSIDNQKARRILFDFVLDVDFIIVSKNHVDFINGYASILFKHGYNILIDKINLQNELSKINNIEKENTILTEQDFLNTINDFWFHSVWTVKKIKRGELFIAKGCLDNYMKQKLLRIIEYHSKSTYGENYNTWYDGRFIEKWAESWIIERLTQCYSHYNKEDMKKALLSTMDLFRVISIKTAEKINICYPYNVNK